MENVEKVHILVAFRLFDTIMHQNPLWNSRGQGHLVTLARGHKSVVCQHFQRASSLKLLGKFHLNFVCSLLAKGERKFIFFFVQVTRPRWLPCLYMHKTLKILILQNHWADCLETLFVAFGALVL